MSLNLIWIDENLDTTENTTYISELKTNKSFKLETFKKIDDSFKYLKTLNFEETKIIISGRLYSKFVQDFKKTLKGSKVLPKILVFTGSKKKFIEYNSDYLKNAKNVFEFSGIFTSFKEIKEFLKNDSNSYTKIVKVSEKSEESTLEFLDNKNKAMLPLFYQSLLDKITNEKILEYAKHLYKMYSTKNNKMKASLDTIISDFNASMEKISKSFVRIYIIESNFYWDINKDLRMNKFENHLPFIKALYEGVRLKYLPLSADKILYRAAKMPQIELEKIKNSFIKKQLIFFSKVFLSFTPDMHIAKDFMGNSNVFFILEIDNKIGYNLMSHCETSQVSLFPNEREVLFFPFSAFEIKEINEKKIDGKDVYEIKLLYLGKYIKDIENSKNEISLPDSEFKKQLMDLGLIKKESKEYNDDRPKETKLLIKEINNGKNIIISEVYISSQDIGKDIQIINSYENYSKKQSIDTKYPEYYNDKDIKENVEIKINGEKIPFSYMHKFKKEGKYKIEYIFKKELANINHMFCGCWKLISLDLSNFSTQNVINMDYLFYDCFSLISLNLSNLNTQSANSVKDMFQGCKSLENINLANSHIQNVNDKSSMLYDCNSLKKKVLSLKSLKFE